MQNPYKSTSSLNTDPCINSTIKENPYRSTVEIEGNERVLAPDMGGLYLAKGKKHSQGGMKVDLPDNSFVFSDDKDLALDKTDHELFELKQGGNFKKVNNTPSRVLKRNVDEKHYNSMVNKISDPLTDDITKRTAGLMLNKYEDAIGKIAFIQEGKKDFPTGIPEFAREVAPVYKTELKDEIMQQEQYMKKGGFVNPYAMKDGGKARLYGPQYSKYIQEHPENFLLSPQAEKLPVEFPRPQHRTEAGTYNSNFDLNEFKQRHSWYFNNNQNFDPKRSGDVKSFQSAYNNKAKELGYSPYFVGDGPTAIDDKLGTYTYNAPGFNKTPQYKLPDVTVPLFTPKEVDTSTVPQKVDVPYGPAPIVKGNPLSPIAAKTEPQGRTEGVNWQFNPYQKANLAADALQYMGVKQEFPYRSQVQSPLVELERVNPQSALNQVDNSTYQNYQNSRSLNPYLAQGNNMQAFGQSLDTKNSVQSQYDNQNVQIANHQNILNNQIQRQDQQFNVAADQQYYRESAEGRKNFDNLKQFAFNNFRSDFNDAVEQNQQLAYGMASQPYAPFKYDFKTGQFQLTGNRSILDVQNPNAKQENVMELVEQLKNQGYSDQLIGNIIKSKTIQNWNPPPQKKGGLINPYKK